ncbi:MAG: sialate O-acetylesterase [Pseudomonadota bacterium]
MWALFLAAPGASAQSNGCTVVANTISAAQSLYASHCSAPRKDCDPINGQWYCSSQNISASSLPDNIYSGASQPGNSSGGQATSGGSSTTSTSSGAGQCIDPDGDGWGWNGVASCRVSNTGSTAGSSSTPSASPSTSSACVDPDGDGWGWNGTSSCRVSGGSSSNSGGAVTNNSGSSGSSSTTAACVDSDGDGWGWNGSSSCRVDSTQKSAASSSNSSNAGYRAADITDLVLLTGQSNALGANTDYDASLDGPHKQVFAFTSNGWREANLNQIWDRGWHPRNNPNTDPSNNLLLHFGKRLVARDSDRVVGFILVSEPGAAISNWDYNSEFYRAIDSRVIDAINQLPHKSQLDGILWHQGETDANDTDYYTRKLNDVIANFRSENWYSSGKPFICGEIAKRGGVNNRLNRLNSDNDNSTACVSAAGLSTRIDGSHFDAEGLRELGKRYADRYYSMTD